MRYLLSFLVCISTCNLYAGAAASKPAEASPMVRQPVDQTDIFAIPLDENDSGQEEEVNLLEHPKK
ncbi:hypothetical protein PHSC3_001465 [Chlamydiales bacterium STE3]|nr:hypothetical protein PHSC3_001465 [Chlamydiales bacterium STE3]